MNKVIDQDYVEKLGRDIEKSGRDHLPSAASLANEAAETMYGAAQAGGILVAAAFFFATEYTMGAWGTKHDDAVSLNTAAGDIAKNWRDIEQYHSAPPGTGG